MSTEENAATRRSRRSTAGNRMQAALAEITIEDASNNMDEDDDFVNDKEQDDIFESDFESTDEEATQSEIITSERDVQEEERRSRKQGKSKLERITAVAEARFRATFNPDVAIDEKADKKQKERRRVSSDLIVNAETGGVTTAHEPAAAAAIHDRRPASGQQKIRQSRRKHTMQNTVETDKRLKSSEVKKAAAPKKAKVVKKLFTQGELLARALDTEEGNLVEHRDYLMLEEEKRRRAKVIKTAVEGPLVRWVSRLEQVQVASQPALPTPETSVPGVSGTSTPRILTYQTTGTSHPYIDTQPVANCESNSSATQTQSHLSIQSVPVSTGIPLPQTPLTVSTSTSQAVPLSPQPNTTEQAQPVMGSETVAKNYVIHELGQFDGIRKPTWSENMRALFGDHVAWDEVRVYVGKGRPMSRPKHICPITGRQAMYLDPRTGVPYANLKAFRILTGLLEHKYIWNAELGCYVGQEEEDPHRDDVTMDQ